LAAAQESVTTDAECEGLRHVTGGDVLVTGAGWALGREQLNSFAFVKEFREVNVNVNELRLGFSITTRNPEGILSHNNRKS
jgi:hypothetical protein